MKIKILTLVLTLFFTSLSANYKYESNLKCKKCHPDIYKEHQATMHNNSTIFKDPIHKAVWDKHPVNTKKGKYKCAKCHTPTADNLEVLLGKGTKGIPDIKNPTHTEGISCAYCHRIESIQLGSMANKNIMSAEEKDYFGTLNKPVRNKFHYTAKNEIFKNGNVCMGCHSHKKNKEKLDVCVTGMEEVGSKDNCITCHMPKVAGSISTKEDTPTHSYHGFPGARTGHDMLAKYIDMTFSKTTEGFNVSIFNQSPHDLMLHPLRFTQLKVILQRDGVDTAFKPEVFIRLIGKDNKASPPWTANAVVKNTMIKAKETRVVAYAKKLKKGDTIKIVLGFYLVNPKLLVKFALQDYDVAKKFNILKEILVEIKE